MTGGDIRLGPGTLYEAIQRLEEDGLIEEAPRVRRSTVSADGLGRRSPVAPRCAWSYGATAVLTRSRAISPGLVDPSTILARYHAAVHAYPASFRRRFQSELESAFLAARGEPRYARRGGGALLWWTHCSICASASRQRTGGS